MRAPAPAPHRNWIERLNTSRHDLALSIFMLVVLAHWSEHVAQAIQLWVLDRPPKQARGLLGQVFPWLVTSEWLHYGYSLVMLVGIWLLRKGFVGRSRQWWSLALGIQFWHHFEHLLLLLQAQTGKHLDGRPVPTSLLQLLIPRVELHLFYNSLVFAPMVVAILLHRHATPAERSRMQCACALGTEDFSAVPGSALPSQTVSA
jgi:hypothetical protein